MVEYDISTSEFISPYLYNVIRCDRNYNLLNVSRGGGVFLAAKSTLKIEQIDVSELRVALNYYLIEIVGCKSFLGKDEFLIFVVYFPRTPSLPELTTFCNYFEHNFVSTNNIIILGGFNMP
jgi:hypothetical protein